MNDKLDSLNEDDDRNNQVLIESLLQSLYETGPHDPQSLISGVLEQIDDQTLGSQKHDESLQSGRRRWRIRMSRWALIGLAAAAAVLIAFILPMNNQSHQAMATIRRSLDQASLDVGRHYSVLATFRGAGGRHSERASDLFVHGSDQFAIRTAAVLTNGDLWLGSERGNAWVAPPIGPVFEGDRLSLIRWLTHREKLTTPYLNLSTILKRMGESYRLEVFPDGWLESDLEESVWCRHIAGRLKTDPEWNLPVQIELWADAETGVARRVIATWDLGSGETGRESLVIEYLGKPDLPDDWFRADGHVEEQRRRLKFDSGAEK